jgi:hypothetical protein
MTSKQESGIIKQFSTVTAEFCGLGWSNEYFHNAGSVETPSVVQQFNSIPFPVS